jgi:hypothetical protein
LSKPISRLLAWLVIALLEKTRAHLFHLAEKLPDDETTDRARRQCICRFLSNSRIGMSHVYTSIVTAVTSLAFRCTGSDTLDGPNRVHRRGHVVNVLSIALVLDGITFPLYWIVLSRAGATGLQQWQ